MKKSVIISIIIILLLVSSFYFVTKTITKYTGYAITGNTIKQELPEKRCGFEKQETENNQSDNQNNKCS